MVFQSGFATPKINKSHWLGLPMVDNKEWDEQAVRDVLKVFAYGGHATDAQLRLWASMPPRKAIKEMLNFKQHNLLLSPVHADDPYNATKDNYGTLWSFRNDFLGSDASNLPIPKESEKSFSRSLFAINGQYPQGAWIRMATTRGLNPFRQKIGYWETHHHMAVNLMKAVTDRQITVYYDDILNAHAANKPYEEVIATAAKSAAVTYQYNVQDNVWVNGECQCNEDFAREIHQLFFGILGKRDPKGQQHHENVTIKNTAKALTDMRVDWVPFVNGDTSGYFSSKVSFGTAKHHKAPLHILNRTIHGKNAAEKIDSIAKVAIQHPESLDHLPITIISGLADDRLTPQKKAQLRMAWRSMPRKNFLEFIQAYAISTLFHDTERVKYFSSVDRMLYTANKLIHNNEEALRDHYKIARVWTGFRGIKAENVDVFMPAHNVFGAQTGIEAANSPSVFENNYNRYTELAEAQSLASCDTCNNGKPWRKNWGAVIPVSKSGMHSVESTAKWLWQHFIGDSWQNFGEIESAYITALLGSDHDLNTLLCVNTMRRDQGLPSSSLKHIEQDLPAPHRCDINLSAKERYLLSHGYSPSELTIHSNARLLKQLNKRSLDLNSTDLQQRLNANQRVGRAINFILAIPFAMAQASEFTTLRRRHLAPFQAKSQALPSEPTLSQPTTPAQIGHL